MSVEQRVKQIIVEMLGVDEFQVVDSASFVDDLGADSLDAIELLMAFEEEFDLDISDEEAEKAVTVVDAIKYIRAGIAKRRDALLAESSAATRSNADYLGLPIDRMPEHNFLMRMPMNQWPPTLHDYCKAVCEKYGVCGDVLASAVADWLKTQPKKIYPEVN